MRCIIATIILVLSCWSSALLAATSGFTYQGQLRDGETPLSGAYDFSFTLFDAASGGAQVGTPVNKNAQALSNGLFTVELDFGAAAFDGNDRWLEIAYGPAGGAKTTLSPRQKITPAPYAIRSAADATQDTAIAGKVNKSGDTMTGALTLNADPTANLHAATKQYVDGAGGGKWSLTGNAGTTPGTHFLGTTDNASLEFRVKSTRALQFIRATNVVMDSPSVLGGLGVMQPGVEGGIILGGGRATQENKVTDNYGVVVGGINNKAGDDLGTVDDATYAFVGGGEENWAVGSFAAIAGGAKNLASARSFVGGGENNWAQGFRSCIGGGFVNRARASHSVIAGGLNNEVAANNSDAAVVSGGEQNTATRMYAVVGGGRMNAASGDNSTIGGGYHNSVTKAYATIGGGYENGITADYATIAGGESNRAEGTFSAVVGGCHNLASGSHAFAGAGLFSIAQGGYSAVVGGSSNFATGHWSGVVGGTQNEASARYSIVGGGYWNIASGDYSAILGGERNRASGLHSFAGGTYAIAAHDGAFVFADHQELAFASIAANEFAVRCTGGARFVTANDGTGAPTAGVSVASGGTAWNAISDRSQKKNFRALSGEEILAKIAELSVERWNYKWEDDAAVPHIGPVAQEFKAAFFPGRDAKVISTLEFDGVEMAALKALEKRTTELKTENDDLKRRVEQLEKLVGELAKVGR